MNRSATRILIALLVVLSGSTTAGTTEFAGASGAELMQAVQARHQRHPHVFERQVMVLVDRFGNRETRRLRRYTRIEDDGTVRFLLLFDGPPEVVGVALTATRDPAGTTRQRFYLPALGPTMIESTDVSAAGYLLGSDFTVENLAGEILADYHHVRRRDERIDGVRYYRVDVHPRDADPEASLPLRRHFIRQDILFITRTDHLDDTGAVQRRQTQHDLVPVGGGVWRPNLIRMDNLHDRHTSLLRVLHRVFSADHVPAAMFTDEWILSNRPATNAPVAHAPEEES